MLSLDQIKQFYPQSLQAYERFIVREYLQYKILELIFESPFANNLSFLGDTCLRIVHGNQRFSEDLDFDNFNLSIDDFTEITKYVKVNLEKIGYQIEMRNITAGAYHCYIKFPQILFDEGLSNHKEEKILIQLDTEAHDFEFTPDKPILNKFDVFTPINATPKSLLLSQKFYAVLNRKRNKGRDFFDIVFLLGQNVSPDFTYLEQKVGIKTPENLKQAISEKCSTLNMKEMADDVRPFLFESKDEKKILLFSEYIKQHNLH